MNLQEVIEESRILLNDVQHNINQGYSDSIIQDRTILLAINRCIRDIEFRTGVTSFGYEETEFNVPVIVDQEYYNFPANVISISNLKLERTNTNERYYLDQIINDYTKYNVTISGIPKFYVLDYKPGVIKLFPKPTSPDFILKFTGRKSTTRFTMKDINKEMPFDARFHDAYIMYVCGYVTKNLIDADNTTRNRSADYFNDYQEIIRQYRNDIAWKNDSGKSIRFDNGDYQT